MSYISRQLIITWMLLTLIAIQGAAQSKQPEVEFDKSGSPLVINNDGFIIDFQVVPQRAVTMNQTPTEIMLALGLENNMVGTAYIDDEILPELLSAYKHIPVLAEKYPSKEILFSVEPDFVYGGFASAFSEKRGLPTREELLEMGINSYLSNPPLSSQKKTWSMDDLYREIQDIGRIFRIENKTESFINAMKNEIASAITLKEPTAEKPVILWLDSFGENGPFIGGGTGPPNTIITLAGGKNAFSEIDRYWAPVSREQIVDRHIDYIVLIEASWSSARSKIKVLEEDPVFSQLEAVKEKRFVIINYSASTAGIRIPTAVKKLADALKRQ